MQIALPPVPHAAPSPRITKPPVVPPAGFTDEYVRSPEAAEAIRSRWVEQGARRAGIDLAAWKPELGYRANEAIVLAVPRYYANLYLQDPAFEWPAMGALVAAQFVAGMQDAAELGDILRDPMRSIDRIPGPIGDAIRGAVKLSGAGGLNRLEARLLTMQQQIFFDMSMMHEAYLGEGLDGIRGLRTAGLIDDVAMQAWRDIDLGRSTSNFELLHAGAKGLAWREQMQIISDEYDEIRNDGAGGAVLTRGMTLVGRVPIPGARSPLEFSQPRLGPIKIPFPMMNISERHDRWRIIDQDTMPATARLLEFDAATARTLVAMDINERIRKERLRQGGFLGLGIAA